jgi:hypothetical protein
MNPGSIERDRLRTVKPQRRAVACRNRLPSSAVAAVGVALLALSPGLVLAQGFNPSVLEASVVRVVVRGGGKSFAASGFVWQKPGQIVTSLHAVPGGFEVTVECKGRKASASVAKVLARADLALLTAADGLGGCTPIAQALEQKPAPGSELHTFGFHAGAQSGSSRRLHKGFATRETLDGLVAGASLADIKAFGMPAPDLDIYYVEGGLLPGYSGAPVVDGSGRLIGIADGGLNKGQSDYNWVIPVRYLTELLASGQTQVPAQVAQSGPAHFSAGIAEADARTIIEFEQYGRKYRFVLTKTRSLAELARTADDPDGVRALLGTFGPALGGNLEERLRFDIYEDEERGLIIAVPEGQSLRLEPDPEDPDFRFLVSEAAPPAGGSLDFQEDTTAAVLTWDSTAISANDARYLSEVVSVILEDCGDCELDTSSLRMIDFGNGNKILKLGIDAWAEDSDEPEAYLYYSYAVRGDAWFEAQATIDARQPGLIRCVAESGSCANSPVALAQLAQLVAAHLTTFANLEGPEGKRVLETAFEYEFGSGAQYFEGDELRFYHRREGVWEEVRGDRIQTFDEVEGEPGFVTLADGGDRVRFPEDGGAYERSEDGGRTWRRAGRLERR